MGTNFTIYKLLFIRLNSTSMFMKVYSHLKNFERVIMIVNDISKVSRTFDSLKNDKQIRRSMFLMMLSIKSNYNS